MAGMFGGGAPAPVVIPAAPAQPVLATTPTPMPIPDPEEQQRTAERQIAMSMAPYTTRDKTIIGGNGDASGG